MFRKLKSLFMGNSSSPQKNDQSLTITIQINSAVEEPMADFSELEERLIDKIDKSAYGEFDGNEIATDLSHARFYFYAPDADKMLGLVAPLFLDQALITDASFQMLYGADPTACDLTISLEQVRNIYGRK